MTGFILKIIALVTMLIDHSSIVIYESGLISADTYFLLRGIGRMAFPIYAFFLVKGFGYTKSREKYILRLMLFALLSQLPFTLYFSCPGRPEFGAPELYYTFPVLFAAAGLSAAAYWRSAANPDFLGLLIIICFMLFPGLKLQSGNVFFLDGSMNIFYSLAIGLSLISYLERLRNQSLRPSGSILCGLSLAAVIYFIQPASDYGISALILILGLYLLNSRSSYQAIFICLWAFLQYGLKGTDLVYSLFASLSGLLVFFYNGRKGPGAKYLFYLFYPLHLLLFAIVRLHL